MWLAIGDTYGDDVRGDNGGDEHGVDKVIYEMANMEVEKVADLVWLWQLMILYGVDVRGGVVGGGGRYDVSPVGDIGFCESVPCVFF